MPSNSFPVLTTLSGPEARDRRNALAASFLGWTLDAFDFFVVVMVLTEIAKDFHRTNAEIALTLTATLAFRPIGAFIFGLMADKYGRRLPLMIDVVFFSVIEVASGLAPNFTTFLILRALFGIGMGGEWGVGASLAMEAVPPRWRGILSGLLQEGYAAGYLLASSAYFLVLPHLGWRAMFFIGGAPALLAWFIRRKVKESDVWERSRRKDWSALWISVRSHVKYYVLLAGVVVVLDAFRRPAASLLERLLNSESMEGTGGTSPFRILIVFVVAGIILFMADVTWHVAEGHRKLFFYLVALMTMMSFVSHGTQDMYPTFLKVQRGFSPRMTAIISIIANLGALIGGICGGLFSDRFGRRRGMITALLIGIVIIPLWVYSPTASLLMLGAFMIQFMVQGAWGVIPAHITELSPDSVRGFLAGFAYQCGILIAGSVAYLEAIFANRMNYANAMAATAFVVFLIAAVVIALGREKRGIEFGVGRTT
ncbi:MAG: MFS transporter [Acidobacteriia bacterium]|nr:MFS transporter [Terriglobia bacterium]